MACGALLYVQVLRPVEGGLGILFLATLFVFALIALAAHRMVRPLKELSRKAALGEGTLTQRAGTYTEVRGVAAAMEGLGRELKTLGDSREEFVSNVSHELKTPLTSMKVLADALLAQEDAPPELYREFLQDITREIERENDIISDLLSLVKMDRQAPDVHFQNTDINDLLEQTLKRLRPIAEEKNVDLVLESFRPVWAEVDEVKLSLACTNLVENAIKYNRPGGFVHVSLNGDHKYFYIKVSDSGIGIPEEDQPRIFERFYRVDKSHSQEIGGTGLGLAIARSAVLLHRGSIKVYSTPGEGTTFTLRIPLNCGA